LDLGSLQGMPRLMEVAPHLATWDSDAEFESGMEAIIDAIRRCFGV
jgi:hypothetical protein